MQADSQAPSDQALNPRQSKEGRAPQALFSVPAPDSQDVPTGGHLESFVAFTLFYSPQRPRGESLDLKPILPKTPPLSSSLHEMSFKQETVTKYKPEFLFQVNCSYFDFVVHDLGHLETLCVSGSSSVK